MGDIRTKPIVHLEECLFDPVGSAMTMVVAPVANRANTEHQGAQA
jgi:hypothetical protein